MSFVSADVIRIVHFACKRSPFQVKARTIFIQAAGPPQACMKQVTRFTVNHSVNHCYYVALQSRPDLTAWPDGIYRAAKKLETSTNV